MTDPLLFTQQRKTKQNREKSMQSCNNYQLQNKKIRKNKQIIVITMIIQSYNV